MEGRSGNRKSGKAGSAGNPTLVSGQVSGSLFVHEPQHDACGVQTDGPNRTMRYAV